MENEVLRRLIYSAILAATGAIASIIAAKLSDVIYQRVFDEEPPQ